ncbi:O-antigen ligase family protein [Candidatus Omnitrophota bacterium]
MFASALKKEESIKLIGVILIGASILSIYGIYQYLWGFEHTKEYLNLHSKYILETSYIKEIFITKRSIASFFSPNMFASYLVMAIPLCAGLILDNTKNKKLCLSLSLCLISMLTALLFTKSLAGWTSLSFGVIVFFILLRRFPRRITLIVSMFILVLPFFLLLLRYNMFINFANQQNTILQRLSFWRSTSQIIKDFPLKGIGLGNLGNIYPKYIELLGNETRFAHNIFLQTWAETGLLGIISIVLLIWVFIKRSFRLEKNHFNAGLITSCYIFIINNLFDFSYFIPQVSHLWWISLGIISQKSITASDNKGNNRIRPFILIIILLTIYFNTKSLAALRCFQKGEYKKAISLEPYNDLYHIRINDYRKAISLNPYSPFYHKNLGMLYLNNNRIEDAISELEKASAFYPANEALHKKLFELYIRIGETEKAAKEEIKIQEFYSKYSGYFIR